MEPEACNQKYCAEIRVPLSKKVNGQTLHEFSSGFAIGLNLILGCYHGLFPDNYTDKPFKVTWRELNGKCLEALPVDRSEIVWKNKELDIVIIRCSCPHRKENFLPNNLITTSKPWKQAKWHAGGYQGKKRDIQSNKQFKQPSGRIAIPSEEGNYFVLDVERHGVDAKDDWGGFSGTAVFIGEQIAGIILSANDSRSLTAVNMACILDNNDDETNISFKQLLNWQDIDPCKLRQDRLFSTMLNIIKQKKEAHEALADSMRNLFNLTIPNDDVKQLVEKFNRLDEPQAIDCINEAFSNLCINKNVDSAKTIALFAEAWLPITFPYDADLHRIKNEINDIECAPVEIPCKLGIATEVVMAEVEEKPAKLEKTVDGKLVSYFDLGNFSECGLNEDGKQTETEMHKLLKQRFNSKVQWDSFERETHRCVNNIGLKKDSSGMLFDTDTEIERREKLAMILDNLYRINKRRFFCCVDAEEHSKIEVFKDLKKQYPALAFLASECPDIKSEAGRYSLISLIIITAKGDTSLCEGMT